MLYTICIALILVASVLVILAVLVQNPKSGMAANFGASNQVMGVRETTNFLEKFTWAMAIAIVVLSLVATLAMDKSLVATSNSAITEDAKARQRAENPKRQGETAPCAVSFCFRAEGARAPLVCFFVEACGRRGGALLSLFLFSGGWPAVAAVFVSAGARGRWCRFPDAGGRCCRFPDAGGCCSPGRGASPGRGLFTRLNHAGTMIFENNWLNL